MNAINADRDLSSTTKSVAYALLFTFHNTKTGQCNPSFKAIGKAVGRCRSVVAESIDTLTGEGGWFVLKRNRGAPDYTLDPGRLVAFANVMELAPEEVRYPGPLNKEEVRDTGCLEVRYAGPKHLKKNITPLNPPRRRAARAAGASRTMVFVADTDEHWPALAKRWRIEKGKAMGPPAETFTEHPGERGWHFDAEWIAEAAAAAAAAGRQGG